MPIFDYECQDCGVRFESIEVWSNHVAKECKVCHSPNIKRCISTPNIRMDSDTVLRSLPDPVPPLEELRGKTKKGCVGGYEDKPYMETDVTKLNRKKDKYGNSIWSEKRPSYHTGSGSRRSAAERKD